MTEGSRSGTSRGEPNLQPGSHTLLFTRRLDFQGEMALNIPSLPTSWALVQRQKLPGPQKPRNHLYPNLERESTLIPVL